MPSQKDILESYNWIRVKKFKDDESLPIADRLARLQEHHEEETTFLINFIRDLVLGKVTVSQEG